MNNLREYLRQTYPGPFPNMGNHTALKSDIYTAATVHNGYNWLIWFLEESENHAMSYWIESVADRLEVIGIITVEELGAYLDAHLNLQVSSLINLIDPKAPSITSTDMAASELVRGIRAYVSDQVKLNFADGSYRLPNHLSLLELIKACPSKRYAYLNEKRDCDDFTRVFLGWLSEQGLGNLTIGECLYEGRKDGKVIFGHSCIAALTSTGLWLVEPQNGRVWEAGTVQPGMINIDESRITELRF